MNGYNISLTDLDITDNKIMKLLRVIINKSPLYHK